MSMPTIFFTAAEAAAAQLDLNHDLPPEDVHECGGVDVLKLSTLWAIIDGRDWDPAIIRAFGQIKSTNSEWTYSIPADLTQKIASVEGVELERVTKAWSATDEMACSPGDAMALLSDIARVARRALETQRQLFLYTCL